VRRVLLLLAVLCALVGPASASAERAWGPLSTVSTQLAEDGYSLEQSSRLLVTATGDVIYTWNEGADFDHGEVKLAVRPHDGSATTVRDVDPGAGQGRYPQLASDSNGNAYLLYYDVDGHAHFEMRPPGGSFGSEEVITSGNASWLMVAPDGDVALGERTGLCEITLSFRPAGGSFGPPQPFPAVGGGCNGGRTDMALASNGEVVAVWGEPGSPRRMASRVRSPSGAFSDIRYISDGKRNVEQPDLAVAADGRAVATWTEDRPSDGGREELVAAQRPAGGEFEAGQSLTRKFAFDEPRASIAPDGAITIDYPGEWGLRFFGGEAGQSLRALRSFVTFGTGPRPALAVSPSGNHLITLWSGFAKKSGATWAPLVFTVARNGAGALAPVQDVRRDCAAADFATVAVGDNGQAAALVARNGSMRLTLDAPGTGQQRCGADNIDWNDDPYSTDPYAPAARGGPGGGSWETSGPQPSGLPIGARARRGNGVLFGLPWVDVAGRTARVHQIVSCGGSCRIALDGRLRLAGGRSLGGGAMKRHAQTRAEVVVSLRLAPGAARTVRRVLAGRSSRTVTLRLRLTTSGPGLARHTRTIRVPVHPPAVAPR
jgi:hypothetical protein